MDFGDFTITKREIIFSIVIIAIMLTLGFIIHGSIDNALMLKHQEYNTALRIENDADMFNYGMSTNVGNAYVHGTVSAVDTVSYPEVKGEYSYIEKVKEEYTQHTRVVTETHTDSKGTSSTFPIITTRCDGANENSETLLAEKVAGTTGEQSFDVFTVNTKTRTINATKIGAGADRVITY